jgi:AcrR family transcriptional regulator
MPPRDRDSRKKRAEQRESRSRDRGQRSRGRSPRERQPRSNVWDRPEPGARRAGHTREGIAAAAIAIGDAEGFKAISMRRVAAELGAGTMTLYHYVRNKDELLALVDDTIMGGLLIPEDELPEGWREGMAAIARRTRDAFLNHPWTTDMPHGGEGGPNGTRHFEQSLEIASRTGLTLEDQMEVIALVDDYVFGYTLRVNQIVAELGSELGKPVGDWAERLVERVESLDIDEFPRLKQMLEDGEPAEVFERMMKTALSAERFERGLSVLLDGIEGRIERYGRLDP